MANWAKDFCERNEIDPAKIVKRARHGIHVQKGGEIEATFVGAPCHYQDSKGSWQPIDTALRLNTVSNKYYAPGVAVDLAPDGVASVYGQSWQHKTSRVGIWNPIKKTFTKAWDIPELGAVDGDSFVREGKGWEYRQRVTESGLKETLTLFSKPSRSIPTGSYVVLETYVPGLSAYRDGELAEWSESGMHFPLPSAKDSSRSFMPLPCKRWKQGDYLYTGISVETLDKAVYPLTVDPDFVSDSGDWDINSGYASYATARTGSSSGMALTTSGQRGYVGQQRYSGDSSYYLYRTGLKFDSSSVPDGATIASANLKMTGGGDSSTADDFLVYITQAGLGSYWPTTTNNMRSAWAAILSGATDNSLLDTASGVADGTQYTSNALTTSYVSKTGATYYGLISENDIDNDSSHINTVGNQEIVNFYLADSTTTSYRPKLTVTYFIPQAFFRAPMWGRF